MHPVCQNCNIPIPTANINVGTDVAKCDQCGTLQKVSELVRGTARVSDQPPAGSKLKVKREIDRSLTIFLPKNGFTMITAFIIGFCVIWIGFVAFWTFMAAQGFWPFALFSIPFWVVGFALAAGAIKSVKGTQEIRLDRDKLTLRKSKVFGNRVVSIAYRDVQAVELRSPGYNMVSGFSNLPVNAMQSRGERQKVSFPTIITNNKKFHFFEGASDEDQGWVIAVIRKHLER